MTNSISRTIAAVSTPRGKGGLSVIRISGPDAVQIASKVFISKKYPVLADAPSRYAVFGSFLGTDDVVCDTGLLTIFRSPASFTGEDCVELSCHGGTAVTNEILLSVLSHGAYPAGPGEFTKRAFINGKLSLTEAEAVGLLIDADTKEKMMLSNGASKGNITNRIAEISGSMTSIMAALYAAIDYPEEDVGDEGEKQIGSVISSSLNKIKALLDTYSIGKAVSDGIKCTIYGRPNVGKSSVFNLISGENNAIVTDIPGTTRDVLRETVSLGGVTLILTDTAGIHKTNDIVESIGVEKAENAVLASELLIAVFDCSSPLTTEDREIIEKAVSTGVPRIALINKTDLPCALSDIDVNTIDSSFDHVVKSSCTNSPEELLKDLDSSIREIMGSDLIDLRNDAVIWDARQRAVLLRAYDSLSAAKEAVSNGDPVDCICTLTEDALSALDETDGRTVDDKIVSEVFSKFCVGK